MNAITRFSMWMALALLTGCLTLAVIYAIRTSIGDMRGFDPIGIIISGAFGNLVVRLWWYAKAMEGNG